MKRDMIASLAGVLAAAGSAQAAFLTNGDFEGTWTGNLPANWSKTGSGAFDQVSPNQRITGAHSLRLVSASSSSLAQTLSDPGNELSKWSVSFDLAASDPGASADRSFDLLIRHGASGSVRLRLVDEGTDGDGDIQALSGTTTWTTRRADAVEFTTGNAGTGAITISGAVNHIEIVGDYTASPSYRIFVTSDLGVTQSALLTDFVTAAPTIGSKITEVSFITTNLAANSFSVVDNIVVTAVPEPVSALIVAGVAVLGLRRHRRV